MTIGELEAREAELVRRLKISSKIVEAFTALGQRREEIVAINTLVVAGEKVDQVLKELAARVQTCVVQILEIAKSASE